MTRVIFLLLLLALPVYGSTFQHVTLNEGKSTKVYNDIVLRTSKIYCGCGSIGREVMSSCTEAAAWIPRLRVRAGAKNGEFTVEHSYIPAGSVISVVCVID